MDKLPTADAYGAVLFNAKGEVLLREPTGHFGGYVWTFAKGRPDSGETPEQTATREVYEETGYHIEMLDVVPEVFAGSTSSTAFYVAGPVGRQWATTWETASTRWVTPDAAMEMIQQTKIKSGRMRDLAVLRAAADVFSKLPDSRRPATCREDWTALPMPRQTTELTLDWRYAAEEMASIRKGHLPQEMEDKWFAWYEEPILHLHRSWTGHCIFELRFESTADGWNAVSVRVNSDSDQYLEKDDERNRQFLAGLTRDLLLRRT